MLPAVCWGRGCTDRASSTKRWLGCGLLLPPSSIILLLKNFPSALPLSADNNGMSTAADILSSNRRPKIPVHWQLHHRHLCLERDRLMARDCSAPAISLAKLDDMGDAATEESDRCLSLVASTATQDLIFEVLAALRRLERGTYGICEITGKPIEPARLEALPWARYSLEGQQDLEKNGLVRKASLPTVSSLTA